MVALLNAVLITSLLLALYMRFEFKTKGSQRVLSLGALVAQVTSSVNTICTFKEQRRVLLNNKRAEGIKLNDGQIES